MSRKQRISELLNTALNPLLLTLDDESHRHQGRADSESHFKILIVSTHFTNLSRLARHRLINQLLASELALGLHAFSLHLYTPDEWALQKDKLSNSPACRGGEQQD